MQTKPILFSSEMVRAILDGRKTQTRRVIKPQPDILLEDYGNGFAQIAHWKDPSRLLMRMWLNGEGFNDYCPYGQVGDRLWVRETFGYASSETYQAYTEDGEVMTGIIYRATDDINGAWTDDPDFKWKPSIFMPRAASRITLEVTGVRVERLQDISEEDAIAEGIEFIQCGEFAAGYWEYEGWSDYIDLDRMGNLFDSPIQSFKSLWDSINAKKHPWESNPWVWVVEFKKVEV